MAKNTFLFCILLACFCTALWGGGRKENISRQAADPSGFTDPVDTSTKPAGKYNYLYEATDKAGNVALGGPENIYIDPESDLPRVTVINPSYNMRVQGNLNIVGIATDDDGVGYVELTINRGRDGKGEELIRTRARGTEFWSFMLDTTNPEIWTDGEYTITAWATDINELSGISTSFKPKQHKKHQVFWNLDRKNPEITVTSHEVGALVSGKVNLKGTAQDGNGISSLSYSVDNGKTYVPVSVKYDKRNALYNWEIAINSKTFDDGPAVIWLKAKDGTGSIGSAAHLLFANNTNPEVKIVYPDPSTVVFGVFTIAGYASHPVGINKVTWKAGKDSGEIPLIKGNSWWSLDIDTRGQKISAIDIEIKAEDVSGNVTVAKQKYKVDQNAGMARVTLQEPASGFTLTETNYLAVKGTATAADGVASVLYSINGGAEVAIPCSGYFQFIIPDLPEGVHNIEVWAKDVSGIAGPKVPLKGIVVPGPLPEPRFATITFPSGKSNVTQQFYSGMKIQPVAKMVMELNVKASSLTSASVAFGDFPPAAVKASSGKDGFRATVPVPVNLTQGLTKIELRAKDKFNREAVYYEYVFVVADMYDPAGSFVIASQKTLPDGRILMDSAEDVLYGIGDPLESVALRGTGAENFSVSVDQFGRARIQALREGNFGPLTLSYQSAGGASNSAPFRILAAFGGPTITFRDVPDGKLVQGTVPVRLNIASAVPFTPAEYSLDLGATWLGLGSGAEINRTIDINAVEDGGINILVKSSNDANKTTIARFTVVKKTKPTEAQLIMPIAEARVNGMIRMGFAVSNANTLKTVTYTRAAAGNQRAITKEVFNVDTWDKDYAPKFLEIVTNSIEMPLDNAMRFTFEDMAGNRSVLDRWEFVIDNEMDIPTVFVILPQDNEVITSDFLVSGVMFDDDAIAKVYWSLDNGQQQTIEAENGFSIPIPISRMTDNEHYITVIAEDIYGVRSKPERRNFRVSLAEPTGSITFPNIDTVLRDEIEVRGTAADRNGIKEVKVSVDNGNSFNTAAGTETWSYRFNSKILEDGPHVVFYRIEDKYGIQATYSTMINIDNTPPEIILDTPIDGSQLTGIVSIMGQILDPNLESISMEIRSLQSGSSVGTRKLGAISTPLKEQFDISRQADGLYNLEILAQDRAGNITRVSRNVQLARQTLRDFVEILYPLNNEEIQGNFNVYGYAGGTNKPGTVTIRINGIDRSTQEVDSSGFFRFSLGPEEVGAGTNSLIVHSTFGGSALVQSRAQNVIYRTDGPWITIDNISYGDFAYDRPYLSGRTGYVLSEEDLEMLAGKKIPKDIADEIKAKTPDYTEISFDNGRTFHRTDKSTKKNVNYRYRLETGEMKEGLHYILVRTTMKNREVAVTRLLVQVDKTPPLIRVISPEPGSRYNAEIAYSGSAKDDIELISLTYHLRKGDKAFYGVPGFLQGLYFEGTIPPLIGQFFHEQLGQFAPIFSGGATYFDVGIGLSFYDDNVKIQGSYGYIDQKQYEALGGEKSIDGKPTVRYGGHVFELKLLANVYRLPFGSFAGPDWEWLSATFSLGANFSLFDLMHEGYTQSGESTWMSALLLQIEFPRISATGKRRAFRTFSVFTEGQLWFVPTDANASAQGIKVIIPHVIMGLRVYIF
ncbi:MAG: hypothetical protein LBB72_09410 [Spirochaetaceae bacterium]|jgi:hypothetical protein|nr:hypothetical protein [Spirochaetaceae bacterium]